MSKLFFLTLGLGLLSIVICVSTSPLSLLPSVNVEPGDIKSPKAKIPQLGGLGKTNAGDEHVQGLVEKLKPDIIREACKIHGVPLDDKRCPKPEDSKFNAVEYKTQVVAGTNYFVKLRCKLGVIWHAKIFEQPWTNTVELLALTGPKTETDEIEYFE